MVSFQDLNRKNKRNEKLLEFKFSFSNKVFSIFQANKIVYGELTNLWYFHAFTILTLLQLHFPFFYFINHKITEISITIKNLTDNTN